MHVGETLRLNDGKSTATVIDVLSMQSAIIEHGSEHYGFTRICELDNLGDGLAVGSWARVFYR